MGDIDPLVWTLASIIAKGGGSAPLRICQACVAELLVDGAAITMMTDADRQELVCATDEVASELDELQFSLGEGPGVEALTSGRPVLISDLDDTIDHRWPMFATNARRMEVRALYVLPLQLGTIKIGVLDLYRVRPGPLQPEQLTGALRAADAALWTLLGHRAGETLDGDGPLRWSHDYPLRRAEVHQATGMIVAQARVSAETALAMLRASAFANDRHIDEVARDVVARRLRFEEGPR
ncbi:GAF and ANTAR domain-containing protein [Saccharopolyspora sp. 5N708]|uniref:GAF and ANTAR domain-containing protein n=1 Tax=Saccharopolyspora sp. 5N708 TaxID=3457424 RepID=UPI003FD10684